MFATTTSWVMVKNQPVIHLSIGTVMRLAIRNHTQRIETNNKAWESNKAKPNHKPGNQSKSNIHKQCSKQCSEKHKGAKTQGNRMHKVRNRWGKGDLRSRRLDLKSGQKGYEVLMTFGVELLLLLESTLQGSDPVL